MIGTVLYLRDTGLVLKKLIVYSNTKYYTLYFGVQKQGWLKSITLSHSNLNIKQMFQLSTIFSNFYLKVYSDTIEHIVMNSWRFRTRRNSEDHFTDEATQLNGLSCCNFQMLTLRAEQKTTMLKGLAAKAHQHRSSMKQTYCKHIVITGPTNLNHTHRNKHIYVSKHVNFFPIYYFVNFFLYNEKCKCLAD